MNNTGITIAPSQTELMEGYTRRTLLWEHDQATQLRHSLHLKHSRHDRSAWEVAIEELVVDGHILVAYGILA